MTKKEQFTFLVVVAVVGVALVAGSMVIGARMKHEKREMDHVAQQMSQGSGTVAPSKPAQGQPSVQPGRVTPPSGKTPTEPLPQPMNGPLFGTAWQFQKTVSADKKTFIPKKLKEFVLEFETSARLSSNTDCNTVSGAYTAQEGLMTVGPLMATLMYCEGSEQTRYADDLSKANRYSISKDGKTLTLSLKDGGVMTYTRITPTP